LSDCSRIFIEVDLRPALFLRAEVVGFALDGGLEDVGFVGFLIMGWGWLLF
jgi:hypothetical protein